MPTSVSDSGKGAPETSGVATAPAQVNLGPFSISGRIVLLLDDAASGQQQVLQQQPAQEPPSQETSPQRVSPQEPSPEVPSPQGPVGPVFTPETPEAAPGTARIDELIGLLASPGFREREAAEAELTRLARRVPGVEQAIDQAANGASDPEARARIQRILQTLSDDEAEQYAEQARLIFGNLIAIGRRFPIGSDLENEAQADLKEAMGDFKAARNDLRRTGVDARRRRAVERQKRLDERRRQLNPLGDFFGPG